MIRQPLCWQPQSGLQLWWVS